MDIYKARKSQFQSKNNYMIRGDVMINIEKTDNIEQEYLQCSSCLKCNDDLFDDLNSLVINGQI